MFSYRVGICNQCRLNGRILRFYCESEALSENWVDAMRHCLLSFGVPGYAGLSAVNKSLASDGADLQEGTEVKNFASAVDFLCARRL